MRFKGFMLGSFALFTRFNVFIPGFDDIVEPF